MTYKGNRETPKQRAAKKVKADPKFSGGTTNEKFKPIPTGPFVTPDRDMRGQPIFERPQSQEEKDMTPIGGFASSTGRNMLRILQFIPAAAGSFREILSIGGRI
jgi:hypothetical protein|nr:hypothetical protein [uncultured Mediterranean phage uvMED]